MTLTISLSDAQAAALQMKAEAEGLSLEAWIQRVAQQERPAERPLHTAADIILSSMRDMPPDLIATIPTDGASQHDRYIYGWPKRDA